ncbi:MAG TPA: hypothetical protein VE868_06515 [Balneolaceae bacterium]|nr:hypothetical protein [Balneolaceae bacterium]
MTKNEKNGESRSDQTKAEEPETVFKTVHIFDSFEEQEQAEIEWLASQTPEQHLQHTVALIKRIFADELKQHPRIGNKLRFD